VLAQHGCDDEENFGTNDKPINAPGGEIVLPVHLIMPRSAYKTYTAAKSTKLATDASCVFACTAKCICKLERQ
jgi:hypothetical protein